MSVGEREAATLTGATGAFHRVGSAAALGEGQRLIADLQGQTLVIFKVAGAFVAIPAECPHNGGPLCDGDLTGSTVSCPWHGYNFDLLSGSCEDDEDLRLQRFEVQLRGDDIMVKL